MRREHDFRLIRTAVEGDATVVRFTGPPLVLNEDNALVLGDLLSSVARAARSPQLILDFSNVSFVSSAGLGALVRLHKQLQAAGGSLALRGLEDAVYEIFDTVRLTTLFEVQRGVVPERPRPPCILVVDDEGCVRNLLDQALRRHGFEVLLAATGRQALARCWQAPVLDVVLLDVQMPGLSGPETLTALRRFKPKILCCFMTGDPGSFTEWDLLELGAAQVFPKPFKIDEVVEVLRRLSGEGRTVS